MPRPTSFLDDMKDNVKAAIQRRLDRGESALSCVQGLISTHRWMSWIPLLDKINALCFTSAWFYVLTERGLVRIRHARLSAKTLYELERIPTEQLGRATVNKGMLSCSLTIETRRGTFVVDDLEASWADHFARTLGRLRSGGVLTASAPAETRQRLQPDQRARPARRGARRRRSR